MVTSILRWDADGGEAVRGGRGRERTGPLCFPP